MWCGEMRCGEPSKGHEEDSVTIMCLFYMHFGHEKPKMKAGKGQQMATSYNGWRRTMGKMKVAIPMSSHRYSP